MPVDPNRRMIEVPVELTDPEIRERARDIGQCYQELAHIRAEKKEANSEFKSREDSVDANINRLADELRTQKAMRGVEVVDRLNSSEGMVESVGMVDGIVHHTRPATPDDMQMDFLPDEEPEDVMPEPGDVPEEPTPDDVDPPIEDVEGERSDSGLPDDPFAAES